MDGNGNLDDFLNKLGTNLGDESLANRPKSKPSTQTSSKNPKAAAVIAAAQELGIDPLDYATVISYETAGSFDPWQAGPTTKWGQHRGTIQYGEPQRKQYGVYQGQPFEEQVTKSNVRYLRDRGVKPGDDILRIYKAINGGNVNVADNVGDGYGTQVEHVRKMMGDHRKKALSFLGGSYIPQEQQKPADLGDFLGKLDTNLGQVDKNNPPENLSGFLGNLDKTLGGALPQDAKPLAPTPTNPLSQTVKSQVAPPSVPPATNGPGIEEEYQKYLQIAGVPDSNEERQKYQNLYNFPLGKTFELKDGRKLYESGNQAGLQSGEMRLRERINDKGGNFIAAGRVVRPENVDVAVLQSARIMKTSAPAANLNVTDQTQPAAVEPGAPQKDSSPRRVTVPLADLQRDEDARDFVLQTAANQVAAQMNLPRSFAYQVLKAQGVINPQTGKEAQSSDFRAARDAGVLVTLDLPENFAEIVSQQEKRAQSFIGEKLRSGTDFSEKDFSELSSLGVNRDTINQIVSLGLPTSIVTSSELLNNFPTELSERQDVLKAFEIMREEHFNRLRSEGADEALARSLSQIEAAREVNWLTPEKTEQLKADETAAFQQIKEERDRERSTQPESADFTGSFEGNAQPRSSVTFNPTPLSEIIEQSGSFRGELDRRQREIEEAARIEKEYEFRPLARPLEFAKNFYRAFPKAASSVLKSVDIASEILETVSPVTNPVEFYNYWAGKQTPADKRVLYGLGEQIEKGVDYLAPKNKDFQKEFWVSQAPDVLAQIAIQMGLGVVTGGASAPVLLGASMGMTGQYEDATKAGASDGSRKLASLIGGVAAISDAIPFGKFLAPLQKAERLGFINKFLGKIFAESVAQVGEREAAEVARGAFRSMLVNLAGKGKTLATGAVLEGTQELTEKKINDAVAAMTYDPKRKVFTFTSEDLGEFLAGSLGGVGGASVEISLESQANENQSLSQVDLNEFFAQNGESADAEKLNVVPPVPETQSTLAAQMESAMRADSPRAAVLYTKGAEVPAMTPEQSQILTDVSLPETGEVLRVNTGKIAEVIGEKPSPEQIQNYIRENGYADLIAKAENVGTDTAEGELVVARDEQGNELSASKVTTPEAAQMQAEINRQEFGNVPQTVELVEAVVGERDARNNDQPQKTAENITTPPEIVAPVKSRANKPFRITPKANATVTRPSQENVQQIRENEEIKGAGFAVPSQENAVRVVKINDKEVTLTPEQSARWSEEVDTPLNRAKARRDASIKADPRLNRQRAQEEYKGEAMRISAVKREITGELTSTERAAKKRKEASNFVGKPVSVEGKNGKVVGTAFGRVKVEFEDGSVKGVPQEKIQASSLDEKPLRMASVSPTFAEEVDNFSSGKMRDGDTALVDMQSPKIFGGSSDKSYPLVISERAMSAATKNGVTAENLKNLPEALASPSEINERDDDFEVKTSLETADGSPVYASIRFDEKLGRMTIERLGAKKTDLLLMTAGKSDGLAPNGKRSKLSSKFYELVRTDKFKKWFGDWDVLAAGNVVARTAPVELPSRSTARLTIAQKNERRKAVYEQLKEKPIRNLNGGFDITVTNGGLKHNQTYSADVRKIILLDKLKEILENAVFIRSEKPDPRKSSDPNIRGYLKLVIPARFGAQETLVKITVQQDNIGNVFYDTSVADVDIQEMPVDGIAGRIGSADPLTAIQQAYKYYTLNIFGVKENQISGTVDENGEPTADQAESFLNESGDSLLKKAEVSKDLEAVEDAPLEDLLPELGVSQHGATLEVENVETYEFFRRLYEDFQLAQGEKEKMGHFWGTTMRADEIRHFKTALTEAVTDMREGGYSDAEIKRVSDVLDSLKLAARHSKNQTGKEAVKLIVSDEATAEESFHYEQYVQAASNDIKNQLPASHFDFIESLDIFENAGKFRADYRGLSRHAVAHEFVAKIATGQFEYLGIDVNNKEQMAEAEAALLDWAEGFERVNGKVDFQKFEELNSYASEIIKQYRDRKSQTGSRRGVAGDARPAENQQSPGQPRGTGQTDDRASEKERREKSEVEREAEASESLPEEIQAKNRKHSETLRDNGRDGVPDVPYIPETEVEWREAAQDIIRESRERAAETGAGDYDFAVSQFRDPKLKATTKTALGIALIDHLGASGDYALMREIATEAVESTGTAAQALRASQLVSKYDFAKGVEIATKKLGESGKPLTEKEIDDIRAKTSKFAQLEEERAFYEYALNQAKEEAAYLEAENKEIAAALDESQNNLQIQSSDIDNLKRQIQRWKNKALGLSETGVRRNKTHKELLNKKDAIRAKIIESFGESMALRMAAGTGSSPANSKPLNDAARQALVEFAALEILENSSYSDLVKNLNEITKDKLTKAEVEAIHADAWDMTREESSGAKPSADVIKKLRTRSEHKNKARAFRREKNGTANLNRLDREVLNLVPQGNDKLAFAALLWNKSLNAEGFKSELKNQFTKDFPDLSKFTNIAKIKESSRQETEINNLFKQVRELREAASKNIQKKQWENKKQIELTDAQVRQFETEKNIAASNARKARQDLDNYYKKLGEGWGKKIVGGAMEVINFTKGLTATGEISYLLRQGALPLLLQTRAAAKGDWQGLGHGLQGDNKLLRKAAEKAGYKNVSDYLAEHSVTQFIERVRQHPRLQEAQAAGLRFTEIGDFNVADEHFSSKILNAIPLYKRLETAYTLPGDLQRLYIYDIWAGIIEGQNLSKQEAADARRYAARVANAFTGKGDIKTVLAQGGALSKIANTVFFSPSLLVSRFQSGWYLTTGFATAPKGMRVTMAKKGLRFYGALGVMAYVLGMALDPDDNDFGKIIVKKDGWLAKAIGEDAQDLKYDVFAGMDKPLQLGFRTALGIVKAVANNDRAYFSDAMDANQREFGISKRGEPRFLRGKLSPSASWAVDAYTGRDYIGRKYTNWNAITSRVTPMSWGQVYDALLYDRYEAMMKEPGTSERASERWQNNERKYGNALAFMIPAFLGVGVQQYSSSEVSEATEKAMELSDTVSKKDPEVLRIEGGLRSLVKEKVELKKAGEDTAKVDAQIKKFAEKYKVPLGKLQAQAQSENGLLGYYIKDLTAAELDRVLPLATGKEKRIIEGMLKRKAAKEKK